jgi:hypothetical protein
MLVLVGIWCIIRQGVVGTAQAGQCLDGTQPVKAPIWRRWYQHNGAAHAPNYISQAFNLAISRHLHNRSRFRQRDAANAPFHTLQAVPLTKQLARGGTQHSHVGLITLSVKRQHGRKYTIHSPTIHSPTMDVSAIQQRPPGVQLVCLSPLHPVDNPSLLQRHRNTAQPTSQLTTANNS